MIRWILQEGVLWTVSPRLYMWQWVSNNQYNFDHTSPHNHPHASETFGHGPHMLVVAGRPCHTIPVEIGWCHDTETVSTQLGPVLLTLLRHVARILANGSAAFFESCDAIGWNSCDVSQKTLVIQGLDLDPGGFPTQRASNEVRYNSSMVSHECHGVSNHWQLNRLFFSNDSSNA